MEQFNTFTLNRDINPNIKKGMTGVILELWTPSTIEVEFVNEDGTNIVWDNKGTFTLKVIDITLK